MFWLVSSPVRPLFTLWKNMLQFLFKKSIPNQFGFSGSSLGSITNAPLFDSARFSPNSCLNGFSLCAGHGHFVSSNTWKRPAPHLSVQASLTHQMSAVLGIHCIHTTCVHPPLPSYLARCSLGICLTHHKYTATKQFHGHWGPFILQGLTPEASPLGVVIASQRMTHERAGARPRPRLCPVDAPCARVRRKGRCIGHDQCFGYLLL